MDVARQQGRQPPAERIARALFEDDADLAREWELAWERTETIASVFADPELLITPRPAWPPPLFHLVHVASFALGTLEHVHDPDPELSDLFGRPFDQTGSTVLRRWPRREQVRRYVEAVREAVRHSLSQSLPPQNVAALQAALDHEYLHQECLLALLRLLPGRAKRAPAGLPPPSFATAGTRHLVGVPAGALPAGLLGLEARCVPAFRMASLPVMNGEFFEFLSSGAYDDPNLWDWDDWRWRQQVGLRHPVGWRRSGREWLLAGVFEDLPLARVFDWPACVSLPEARAWARWRAVRLPTGAEWLRAVHTAPGGEWRRHPWGDQAPTVLHGNFDLRSWCPAPVGTHPRGASGHGIQDLVGDGWEWTLDNARDESSGGVLLGASWASASRLVRRQLLRPVDGRSPWRLVKFRTVEPARSP